ncbi:hypothetical protein HK099_001233, partial [Clydaea vesicula]
MHLSCQISGSQTLLLETWSIAGKTLETKEFLILKDEDPTCKKFWRFLDVRLIQPLNEVLPQKALASTSGNFLVISYIK